MNRPQKTTSKGFILVTVMSFLLLMTLLTLGVMETSILLRKQTNSQWQFWQLSTFTSESNQEIAESLLHEDAITCFSTYQADNRYWERPASQWGKRSCQKKHSIYQSDSIIELLPETLCVPDTEKEWRFFKIYRITTQTQSNQGNLFRAQSSVIRLDNTDKTCTHIRNEVSSGLQSWRIDFNS